MESYSICPFKRGIVFLHSFPAHLPEGKGLNLPRVILGPEVAPQSLFPYVLSIRPGYLKTLNHLYGRKRYQQGFEFKPDPVKLEVWLNPFVKGSVRPNSSESFKLGMTRGF